MHYAGKTALVTGASSGIGAAFAHKLAELKMNLVLVARSEDKLQALATQLREHHRVRIEVITADLSREGEGLQVYEAVQARQLHIDMLINNAGFSTHGAFESILPDKDHHAATKAFVLSFSEALWVEYRKRGIKVLALCPGATSTEFFNAMGRDVVAGKHSPQRVVRVGLSALEHDRHYVIPGFRNSFESNILPRLLPRAAMATLVESVSQRAFR